MTRPFLPPPDPKRCCAIVYRTGWEFTGSRCAWRRDDGSDLCVKHQRMQDEGQRVARVKPPRMETK